MIYVTWVGVNDKKLAFTEEDKILIKVLRQEHGYGAKRFLKEFSNNGLRIAFIVPVFATSITIWLRSGSSLTTLSSTGP